MFFFGLYSPPSSEQCCLFKLPPLTGASVCYEICRPKPSCWSTARLEIAKLVAYLPEPHVSLRGCVFNSTSIRFLFSCYIVMFQVEMSCRGTLWFYYVGVHEISISLSRRFARSASGLGSVSVLSLVRGYCSKTRQ